MSQQQINLYDPALLKKRELMTLTNVVLAGLALLVAMVGWGGWARARQGAVQQEVAALTPKLDSLKGQVAAFGKEIASSKPDPRIEAGLAQMRDELAARRQVAEVLAKGLGAGAISFAEYLRGLARQTPNGLWLTGFTVDEKGSLEIRGRLLEPALMADYIQRLNGEKAFQGRAFSAFKLNAVKPQAPTAAAYHEFSLVPQAAAPAPPAKEGKG